MSFFSNKRMYCHAYHSLQKFFFHTNAYSIFAWIFFFFKGKARRKKKRHAERKKNLIEEKRHKQKIDYEKKSGSMDVDGLRHIGHFLLHRGSHVLHTTCPQAVNATIGTFSSQHTGHDGVQLLLLLLLLLLLILLSLLSRSRFLPSSIMTL